MSKIKPLVYKHSMLFFDTPGNFMSSISCFFFSMELIMQLISWKWLYFGNIAAIF